ncbi:hypothetical protein [Alienimonas californiensis]|uniref:Uncharacterized protein n=1 Tax=Alienimonas californiensis TaxID=2527989 RepID=A0A517PF04_9PLAN|nr:hypothetical protein [Alienimonas californiensis]QDT17959.1 hypothetical protein CA12_40970 [Alienimonas californiensis]
MLRSPLLTAAALLLAPCLFVGCEDAGNEAPVGDAPPANPTPGEMESGSELNMGADPSVERPSEALEDEDGGV